MCMYVWYVCVHMTHVCILCVCMSAHMCVCIGDVYIWCMYVYMLCVMCVYDMMCVHECICVCVCTQVCVCKRGCTYSMAHV